MPVFLRKELSPGTLLGIWKLTESYHELASLLPDKGEMYSERLATFKSDSRKTEFIAVRVLLYHLLNQQKQISYLDSGKPYLADNSYHISISHTKGYVAVIISQSHEVGIDIEQRGEKVNRVAHKFVRADEAYPNHPLEETTRRLLIWSAKEVMYKCLNSEGVDFLAHLKVEFPCENGNYLSATEMYTQKQSTYHIEYYLHEDFVVTWTVIIPC